MPEKKSPASLPVVLGDEVLARAGATSLRRSTSLG